MTAARLATERRRALSSDRLAQRAASQESDLRAFAAASFLAAPALAAAADSRSSRWACVSVLTGWSRKSGGTVRTLGVSTSTSDEVEADSVGITWGGWGAAAWAEIKRDERGVGSANCSEAIAAGRRARHAKWRRRHGSLAAATHLLCGLSGALGGDVGVRHCEDEVGMG